MRHYLSILFLFCFFSSLFGQGSQDCAAEVNPGGKICYDSPMCLTATNSPTYNTPANQHWTFVGYSGSGTVTPAMIGFVNADAFSTCVINNTGSPTWPPGSYTFEFCADCLETNPDGSHDRPCTQTTVVVSPEPTAPVITELDGTQNGQIKGCDRVTFNVNTPSLQPGETATIVAYPNNGSVDINNVGGVVTVTAHEIGAVCQYKIVYSIANGGCVRSTSLQVDLVIPYDPNNDGIIEGSIEQCPSCTNTVNLNGHFPGCGATAVWTVQPGSAGTAVITPGIYNGSATATVSTPGYYIFGYTVTNIAPCPDSYFEIGCYILDIDAFDLGPDQFHYICGNIIPPGTAYAACFNDLPNAIYTWTPTSNPNFALNVSPIQPFCAAIFFPSGYNLATPLPIIKVKATKYYLDKDCEGPELPMVIELPPGNTNQQNIDFIKKFLENTEGCIDTCYNEALVGFYGAPNVEVESSDISFLCSSGSESVKLADYFHITNGVSAIANVTVLSQPSCSNLPTHFSAYQLQQLDVTQCGNCGVFEFKIDIITFDPVLQVATPCTTTIYITIRIETAKEVDAGTEQTKCPGDLIRLHASNPYCSAIGTWTRIQCSSQNYYTVNIADIHDPLTIIDVIDPNSDSICPPDTLCFVWSFTSENGNCDLSDTTRVIIRDSCCHMTPTPCPEHIQVVSKCVENTITLAVTDGLLGVLNSPEYTINWTITSPTPSTFTGNPYVISPYSGPVSYVVEIFKLVGQERICYVRLSGTAKCDVIGCNTKIVESCDSCGNVLLTLVWADSGLPVTPLPYENVLTWWVYGDGMGGVPYNGGHGNPISINEDACYSLDYEQRIFPVSPPVPHVPGYEISFCKFKFPKTCVTIDCPGRCEDFSDFMIAGCGDDADINLGLTFPSNCQNVCSSSTGTSGTFGVFKKTFPYTPITDPTLNIVWENNTTGTYTNGNITSNDEVTITSKLNPCCKWKGRYERKCMCSQYPQSIECQLPITKYCRPDGSYYFVTGTPQISWYGVSGAAYYELEITANVNGCCTPSAGLPITPYIIQVTSPWVIPANLHCFAIRIRGVNLDNPYCPQTAWSAPYVYCPDRQVCSPVIIVCGCCGGERSADNFGLPTEVVSEEAVIAFLNANPGTQYPTLQSALDGAGIKVETAPEFSVYPNPASDQIVVKGNATVKGNFRVQLTDMLQREWRNVTFDGANGNTLNVSDLPKGIYLITIRNANGEPVLTEKVTVLR